MKDKTEIKPFYLIFKMVAVVVTANSGLNKA